MYRPETTQMRMDLSQPKTMNGAQSKAKQEKRASRQLENAGIRIAQPNNGFVFIWQRVIEFVYGCKFIRANVCVCASLVMR